MARSTATPSELPLLLASKARKLDRELVFAGIPVANKFRGTRVEIRLRVLDCLSERLWSRAVEDFHPAAWPFRDLNPVKAGALVLTSRG